MAIFATATLTIQDNDAPGTFQFGAATYSVVEGGTSPVMITRTGGSGGTVVLQWAATGGSATGGGGSGGARIISIPLAATGTASSTVNVTACSINPLTNLKVGMG